MVEIYLATELQFQLVQHWWQEDIKIFTSGCTPLHTHMHPAALVYRVGWIKSAILRSMKQPEEEILKR